LRACPVKVELLTSGDEHLRYVPGPMARAMVAAGHADVAHQNGRVRSIRLVTTATSFAMMIGPPTGDWRAPPFVVRERLDGGVVWRHHPRCVDYE
jgi:hypothetical protein